MKHIRVCHTNGSQETWRARKQNDHRYTVVREFYGKDGYYQPFHTIEIKNRTMSNVVILEDMFIDSCKRYNLWYVVS